MEKITMFLDEQISGSFHGIIAETGEVIEQSSSNITTLVICYAELHPEVSLDMPIAIIHKGHAKPCVDIVKGGRKMNTLRGWLEFATGPKGRPFAGAMRDTALAILNNETVRAAA